MSDQVPTDYFKAIRDTLEVINFMATPALVWLAYKGLKQIKVTRDIAKMEAKREAFRQATEQAERFAGEVFKLDEEVQNLIAQKKLVDLVKVKITEDEKSISINWDGAPKWLDEINKSGHTVYDLANKLEGFSMWFTCGIADESIAFRPCGVSFCKIVRRILPLLVFSNRNDKIFTHTLRLYTFWRNKITLENNLAKQQELEKERKSLKVENIKPIGT